MTALKLYNATDDTKVTAHNYMNYLALNWAGLNKLLGTLTAKASLIK